MAESDHIKTRRGVLPSVDPLHTLAGCGPTRPAEWESSMKRRTIYGVLAAAMATAVYLVSAVVLLMAFGLFALLGCGYRD